MEIKGKRFLVIGGAGFIGSHVVDQLLQEEVAEVIIYDNFFRGNHENIFNALKDPRCKVFPHGGDILFQDILEKAMEGIDGVFHLAALWLLQCHDYPRSAFEVNVRGTFNVIEAAIKCQVKKLIFSSSASVYGNALMLPMKEEHPYNNFTFYGSTKIAGEHFLQSLGHRYGFDWIGLRYMNAYGPRQDYKGAYTSVMHKMLDQIEDSKSIQIFGDGSQQYDFIEVSDIAKANLLAMKSEKSGQFYNVGRGIGITIRELGELLIKLTSSKQEIEYIPKGLTFVTSRIGDTLKAESEIGFKWSVDIEQGMKNLINWRNTDKSRAK